MERRKHKIARDVKKPGSKSKRSVASKDAPDSRTHSFASGAHPQFLDDARSCRRGCCPSLVTMVCARSRRSTGFVNLFSSTVTGTLRLAAWTAGRKPRRTCLALVLLLDQFPRNMFRDTARAFATDAKAREVSRHAIASGFDRELPPIMRMFFYLPFEHSEDLHDQMESVRLALALADDFGKSRGRCCKSGCPPSCT